MRDRERAKIVLHLFVKFVTDDVRNEKCANEIDPFSCFEFQSLGCATDQFQACKTKNKQIYRVREAQREREKHST